MDTPRSPPGSDNQHCSLLLAAALAALHISTDFHLGLVGLDPICPTLPHSSVLEPMTQLVPRHPEAISYQPLGHFPDPDSNTDNTHMDITRLACTSSWCSSPTTSGPALPGGTDGTALSCAPGGTTSGWSCST